MKKQKTALACIPEQNYIHSKWSRDRDLNPGPHPYHGCALPTELSRHKIFRPTESTRRIGNVVLEVGLEPTKRIPREIYSLLSLPLDYSSAILNYSKN